MGCGDRGEATGPQGAGSGRANLPPCRRPRDRSLDASQKSNRHPLTSSAQFPSFTTTLSTAMFKKALAHHSNATPIRSSARRALVTSVFAQYPALADHILKDGEDAPAKLSEKDLGRALVPDLVRSANFETSAGIEGTMYLAPDGDPLWLSIGRGSKELVPTRKLSPEGVDPSRAARAPPARRPPLPRVAAARTHPPPPARWGGALPPRRAAPAHPVAATPARGARCRRPRGGRERGRVVCRCWARGGQGRA